MVDPEDVYEALNEIKKYNTSYHCNNEEEHRDYFISFVSSDGFNGSTLCSYCLSKAIEKQISMEEM